MANDFTGDANCVALWNFDSVGEILTDSIGANTLTSSGSPTIDVATPKVGTGTLVLDSSNPDWLNISDTNLEAGFPLKSGDTTTDISWCCWVNFSTLANNDSILTKFNVSGQRSFRFDATLVGAEYFIRLRSQYDGVTTDVLIDTQTPLSTGVWYHVGVAFNRTTIERKIRVYSASTDIADETTGTGTDPAPGMFAGTDSWQIGTRSEGSNSLNGKLDEVVVFKDILSSDDMDKIRNGVYGAPFVDLSQYHTDNRLVVAKENRIFYEDI